MRNQQRREVWHWQEGSGIAETMHTLGADSEDFEVAGDIISKAIEYSKWKYFLRPKPTLIMHQRYNSEDLSPVEIRILQELSLMAGSRETFIWQGAELSEKDIKLGVYKNT